jgi:UDP-glucose:glycoprotein glucosyltransferase
LDLAQGKSSQIYRLTNPSLHNVYLDSFNGKWIKLDVNKNEGMENSQLFEEKKKEQTGFWNKITNMWSSKKDASSDSPSTDKDTIHIFSVASGHLYERFLSVMMYSVVNHTSSNVKFWIIENFISPDFKVKKKLF